MVESILQFIERFSDIIGIVFQCLTTLIIFFLAFGKDRYMKTLTTLHIRLERLYFPFYQKFTMGHFNDEHRLSSSPFETRSCFLELFSKNIQYMGTKSQALFSEFYIEFFNMLEADDNNSDFPVDITSKNFDKAFIALSNSLLSEYMCICKRLKLPKPLSKR